VSPYLAPQVSLFVETRRSGNTRSAFLYATSAGIEDEDTVFSLPLNDTRASYVPVWPLHTSSFQPQVKTFSLETHSKDLIQLTK
jgi:hypothetical protein